MPRSPRWIWATSNVGRLTRFLEDEGLAEDTIVVFLSDHGEMGGIHSINTAAKYFPYEESIGIPLIIADPRRPHTHGQASGEPINTEDLFPSFCGLAGLPTGIDLPGTDISPLVTAPAKTLERDGVLLEFVRDNRDKGQYFGFNHRGIRDRRYKYVVRNSQPWMFFDLAQDPYEQRNLLLHAPEEHAMFAAITRSLKNYCAPPATPTHCPNLKASMKSLNDRLNPPKLVPSLLTFGSLLCCVSTPALWAADRPNIVWIVAEDHSPLIGPYAVQSEVKTPNLDRIAAEGVVYDNVFAPSPVCAPARFALITGRYASSHEDTQGMRGWSDLPRPIEFFPKYLRDAGYYTANWGKTDYNTGRYEGGKVDLALRDAWNETKFIWQPLGDDAPERGPHWRHRPDADMPFFQQFNIISTHMSQLFPEELPSETPRHDPANVVIPPYQPDTPTVRKYWAFFYDRLEEMDTQVGGVFDDLREDGKLDDSIVFYFSDHGGGLMRSKRYLYDSGTRVPLIVYFGKNYRHLMPKTQEGRLDQVIDFTDFAPTVLNLLDLPIPDYMKGRPFLGQGSADAPPREYAFLQRERMSEHIDLSRGVHDGRFVYLRRYLPQRRLGPPSAFQARIPAEAEWYESYLNGDLTPMQAQGVETKPYEELYDSRFDPYNVSNLADQPAYQATLERLRGALDAQMLAADDTGLNWRMDPAPATLAEIMADAALAAQADAASEPRLMELLTNPSPVARFWGAAGIANLAQPTPEALAALRPLAEDAHPIVQAMAAEALARHGDVSIAQTVIPELLKITGRPNPSPALWVLNALYQLDEAPFAELLPQVETLATGKGEEANAAKWVLHRWEHNPGKKTAASAAISLP